MEIRMAKIEDLPKLTEIYNYEVVHGISTLDLHAKTVEDRKEWFYAHNINNHPLYVAVIDDEVVGYCSLSPYREKEAYRTTVEISIYVDIHHRGKHVATELMEFIVDWAIKDPSTYNIVSVITSGNQASVRLHEKFNFIFAGRIPNVGMKFNEFLSIDNYDRIVK